MKIFLDPSNDGCNVWFYNGNCNVQTLNGNIDEVCSRIKEYVIHEETDEIGNYTRFQSAKIFIDYMGMGLHYMQWFKDNDVKVHKSTYKKMIK